MRELTEVDYLDKQIAELHEQRRAAQMRMENDVKLPGVGHLGQAQGLARDFEGGPSNDEVCRHHAPGRAVCIAYLYATRAP